MKILFLGAGASKGAGYPLANNLLPALEGECGVPTSSAKEAWERFSRFRKKSRGPTRSILMSPNPEIALSFLDLYRTVYEFNYEDFWGTLQQYGEFTDTGRERLKKHEFLKKIEKSIKRSMRHDWQFGVSYTAFLITSPGTTIVTVKSQTSGHT